MSFASWPWEANHAMKIGSRHSGTQSAPKGVQTGKPTSPERPPSQRQHNVNVGRSPGKSGWCAACLLLLAMTGIAGTIWISTQLIVNPRSVAWLNQLFPSWVPTPFTGLKPPQTLAQIQTDLRQRGYIPGEPVDLGKNNSVLDNKSRVTELLLPVLATNQRIVELRLYQAVPAKPAIGSSTPQFQLVNQLAIASPEESFVLAPLVDAQSDDQGSTRPLPLTTLSRFEGKVPKTGIWLNLSGSWNRRNETVTYGQVIHYNPSRYHLSPMLQWSSPAGQSPLWQEVTGGGSPELIINQTLALEPQFQVYQVVPRRFVPNPIQLEEISLIEADLPNGNYRRALLLARNGLWSTSEQLLQSVKRNQGGSKGYWSATAQAQMDLIRWHAQITTTQAEQSWASPAQQTLANLIDGRWERALQGFVAAPETSLETTSLLQADTGRLQKRITTALQVNPGRSAAKVWGTLLIAAQKNRTAAIAWLQKQPRTTAKDIAQVDQLLQQMEREQSNNTW